MSMSPVEQLALATKQQAFSGLFRIREWHGRWSDAKQGSEFAFFGSTGILTASNYSIMLSS